MAPRHWENVDYSISKIVQTEGRTELDCPRFGCRVQVSFESPPDISGLPESKRGKHLSESPSSSFIIGMGDNEVDRNVEDAVKSMYLGEKSDFSLRVKIENKEESEKEAIWGQIEVSISLDDVQEIEPLHKWPKEDKQAFAHNLYSSGSSLFKASRTVDAFHQYRKAAALLGLAQSDPECRKIYWNSVNNIVACHFRWKNFNRVVELASVALREDDPNNVKLLYRRGVAFVEKNDFKEAKSDLKKSIGAGA
eukprot:TRINITY_DN4029_c0_g1_i2.p1 TRINITY_DN4029_c0_g1~~TRINITY_DN4029_c0_g1_i2.p1  ORF type:complete len:251 (+),score=72.99 TRINITY_DN4029_c0_g1_i2:103-855(+)